MELDNTELPKTTFDKINFAFTDEHIASLEKIKAGFESLCAVNVIKCTDIWKEQIKPQQVQEEVLKRPRSSSSATRALDAVFGASGAVEGENSLIKGTSVFA